MKKILITKGDENIDVAIKFNVQQLKSLHNLLIEVVEEYPEMVGYREMASILKVDIKTAEAINYFNTVDGLELETAEDLWCSHSSEFIERVKKYMKEKEEEEMGAEACSWIVELLDKLKQSQIKIGE